MSEEYQNPTAARLNFDISNGHGVVMIPMETLVGTAWAELGSAAKSVYVAMLTKFKRHSTKKGGHENPDNSVKITQKQIEELTKLSHTTVVKAIFHLRGYRQVAEMKVTAKSENRKWVFEKHIPDNKCFVFVTEAGGLERNPTEYTLNGYYINSQR